MQQLRSAIKKIRGREGLIKDEYWPSGEGPQDYQEINEEMETVFDKVASFLRPYLYEKHGFDELLEIYESDRLRYDVFSEVGRIRIEESPKLRKEKIKFFEKILQKNMEKRPSSYSTKN